MTFGEELQSYLRARIPIIGIRAFERSRVLQVLREWSQGTGLPVYVHTPSRGVSDLGAGTVACDERNLVAALDWVGEQMWVRQDLTFVLTESHELCGPTALAHQLVDLVHLARERGHTVAVVTQASLWSPLQRLGVSLALSPPGLVEIQALVADQLAPYRDSIPIEWGAAELAEAAVVLNGLTRLEVENIIATLLAGGAVTRADLRRLSVCKEKFINEVRGLERIPTDTCPPCGGLSLLKAWAVRERKLLTMDLSASGLRPPRGVLLVGVPGCGKSLSARHIAASWELPLFRLDLGAIHGKYLGESEERLRTALSTADQAAPCVLWIDEIEKGLSGAGFDGDGGAQSRMIGHILYWLQEGRPRVYVVATANDVTRLPQELLRRGRFDAIFFIDLPTPDERREIISLYSVRYLGGPPAPAVLERIVDVSRGFTGADLEAAVAEVAREAILSGSGCAGGAGLVAAFERVVPFIRTSPERVEAVRQWGLNRAQPASSAAVDTPRR